MKLFLIGVVILSAVSAHAATKMGNEAIEMFDVMSNSSVQECIRDADVNLVVSEITKTVYRCPGCVDYTITGHKKNIHTFSGEKTLIKIKGKAVPGTVRGWIQTYACSVENL